MHINEALKHFEITDFTEDIGAKMLWAFEQDKETGVVTIAPMDGDKIIIHGKQEAEIFCNILTGHFQ